MENIKYISGIHALNLICNLDTPGDWHRSALAWKNLTIRNSKNSVFGNWGIEPNHEIPNRKGKFYVANHIRALLDLIADGNFAEAQGMRNNFIGDSKYDKIVFEKIKLLKIQSNWKEINNFMNNEYMMRWIKYELAA
jgi:hypothetical protein